MIAYVDERAQGDEPLALLLANFLKNGGRVLRRELLAGGMSKWTYDEAKKRLDDVGAKGQDAMMARHSPKTTDSEPGDGHDARRMRLCRGRAALATLPIARPPSCASAAVRPDEERLAATGS